MRERDTEANEPSPEGSRGFCWFYNRPSSVQYKALVATGVYRPDAAQYCLAHHLQKLLSAAEGLRAGPRVQSPGSDSSSEAISSATRDGTKSWQSRAHVIPPQPTLRPFFQRIESRNSLALTRVLSSHRHALQVDSPRGLFLSGEVGTGKSMLLDLLPRACLQAGRGDGISVPSCSMPSPGLSSFRCPAPTR